MKRIVPVGISSGPCPACGPLTWPVYRSPGQTGVGRAAEGSDENEWCYEIHSTTYQVISAMVGSVTANFSPAMRLTSRM